MRVTTQLMKGRQHPVILTGLLLLASCAMRTDFYHEVEQGLASRNYAVAVSALKANEEEFGESNTVLFNLELGLIAHYASQYTESNQMFLAAEKRMEELYTRSISAEAAAMLLNDNLLPYEGEDFEKVFVNLFLALNFAQMDNVEEALVEARKVDLKLKEYSKQYEGKNTYKQDAFIRYVMGVLYEAGGETNDAFISYRKAYEGYKEYADYYKTSCPTFLKADLVRTAGLLGFDDERRRFEQQVEGWGPVDDHPLRTRSHQRGEKDPRLHPRQRRRVTLLHGGSAKVCTPREGPGALRCGDRRRWPVDENHRGGRGKCHGDREEIPGRPYCAGVPQGGGKSGLEVPGCGESQE
jgi:tetratricopeptide (TPR) repeat protein